MGLALVHFQKYWLLRAKDWLNLLLNRASMQNLRETPYTITVSSSYLKVPFIRLNQKVEFIQGLYGPLICCYELLTESDTVSKIIKLSILHELSLHFQSPKMHLQIGAFFCYESYGKVVYNMKLISQKSLVEVWKVHYKYKPRLAQGTSIYDVGPTLLGNF